MYHSHNLGINVALRNVMIPDEKPSVARYTWDWNEAEKETADVIAPDWKLPGANRGMPISIDRDSFRCSAPNNS